MTYNQELFLRSLGRVFRNRFRPVLLGADDNCRELVASAFKGMSDDILAMLKDEGFMIQIHPSKLRAMAEDASRANGESLSEGKTNGVTPTSEARRSTLGQGSHVAGTRGKSALADKRSAREKHKVDDHVWRPLMSRAAKKLGLPEPTNFTTGLWKQALFAMRRRLLEGFTIKDLEAVVNEAAVALREDKWRQYRNLAYIWGSKGFPILLAAARAPKRNAATFRDDDELREWEEKSGSAALTEEQANTLFGS